MTRPATPAISPFLIVSNVEQTIAFYCEKLGLKTTFQTPDQDPFFAIVLRDGAQIFFKADAKVTPLPEPQTPSVDEMGRLCLRAGSRCSCR
jgi:catechol 2,3-dioxygenase-like lactoylglutathione lyase family enzyme